MGTRWKANMLLWREWDGETIIFNNDSGNTHLVTSTAVEVLRILETEPLDAAQLAQRLLGPSDEPMDEGVVARLEDLLQDLDHLGIVEPAYGDGL